MRRLEVDMHAALGQNQFELHYQPILSLKTHRVVGCEALLRWRHPDHGLIAPDDFLPIAERTGDDHRDRRVGAGAGMPRCRSSGRTASR